MRSRSAFAVVLSLTGALLGAPCAAQSAATEPAASATLGPLDALPHTPSLDLTDLERVRQAVSGQSAIPLGNPRKPCAHHYQSLRKSAEDRRLLCRLYGRIGD